MTEETRGDSPVDLLSAGTGPEWASCRELLDEADGDTPAAELNREGLRELLTKLLLSENLVVLAGLGTSLCVRNTKGERLAPTMQDLWADATKHADFAEAIKAAGMSARGGDIEALLSRCQLSQELTALAAVAGFVRDTENNIQKRCDFISSKVALHAHEDFIRRVARRPTRRPRMKLFTTNYDLSFETAAQRSRFVVIDGFSHTEPQCFDGVYFDYDLVRRGHAEDAPDFISNVFHLYKLHGSVNWNAADGQIIKKSGARKAVMIFPRSSKFELSYDRPYLEMMSRFQNALRQDKLGLLVVGFGFHDAHIAKPIHAAIESNVGMRMMIVDPAFRSSKEKVPRLVTELIRSGDSRLSVVAARFEDLVSDIPDLVASSEEEAHQDRLSRARGRR